MRRQRRGNMIIIRYIFTLFFAAGLHLGSAVVRTSITPSQFITDPESIVSSKDGIFRLGFFSLGDSRNRYVGIWYNNIPGPTIVWAANRDHPLNDSTGVFKIASDGNLVVLDGQGKLYWTSNVTDIGSDQLVAKLLDTGNLVLRESQSNEGRYLWQSFDHPTDTFLPNMQFGVNLRRGKKQTITSWKNDSDPSTGDFSLELDPYVIPQLIIKNGAQKKWRIGPGVEGFLGENGYSPSSLFIFQRDYSKGTAFLSLVYHEKSALSRIILECDGKLVEKKWHEETKEWRVSWSPDIYNNCGPFGIYNQDSRTCSCMRGFEPKFRNESKEGNWSRGCSRRKDLQCEILRNKTIDQNSDRTTVKEADGFLEVTSNVPDYFHWSPGIGYEQCRDKCLHNCACTAYSHSSYRSKHGYYVSNLYTTYFPEMGCMLWTRDLMDTRDGSSMYSFTLLIRVANSEVELDEFPTDKGTNVETIITLVVIGIVLTSVGSYLCWILMGKQIRSCLRWIGDQSGFICCYFLYLIGNMRRGMRNGVEWERKRRPRKKKKRNMRRSLVYSDAEYGNYGREESDTEMLIGENTELKVIEFKTLAIATNNFSEANKLGHGGFGSVYKGTLRDGLEEREIAVKRLSKNSEQGSQEFKNEVLVISKLQHRNLVRLLGCCTHEEEKMLIYEYMPNKSLDAFLFDPTMRGLFDWKKRFEIILGISRGILYLHRDSRLRVIHRDLKASNILLDEELNPKISDFGMARIFGGNQRLQANTRKVAGTFGYMSPEYVIEGRFSEKSDVFSFGVLLLEIVSGKKNSSLCDQELSLRLLGHAWQLWNENNALALVDPTLVLSEPSFEGEILRCIHVGLLCVEEFAVDRPTMATTLSMLTSEIATLPAPKNPAFTERRVSSDSSSSRKISDNNVSITILGGR